MNTKKNLFLLFAVCVLMGLAYVGGRNTQNKTIIASPYPEFYHDSLGVYKVIGSDVYVTSDKKVKVEVMYFHIGESDSFHQMKIHGLDSMFEDEALYGDLTFDDEFSKVGYFYSCMLNKPVKFYSDGDETTYIIIQDKKIPLTYVKSE